MAVSVSDAFVTASIAAGMALVDGGSGAGSLRIYTGTKAATPGTTTAETLLAEVDFNDPAFAAGSAGEQDADTSPALTTTGAADGTPGWFRIVDSNAGSGAAGIIDGTAGVAGSGPGGSDPDLVLNSATIATGIAVVITAGNITQPTS